MEDGIFANVFAFDRGAASVVMAVGMAVGMAVVVVMDGDCRDLRFAIGVAAGREHICRHTHECG